MNKVTYKQVKTVIVTVDNSNADDREYDIIADVRLLNEDTVESFDSGYVMKDGV